MGSILRGVPWFQWWCPEQRPWTLHLLPTAGTLQLAGPRFRQHQQRQLRQLRQKKPRPYCTQQLFSRRATEILPKPLRMPTTTCKAERLKDQNWSVESCNVEMRNAMAIIIKNARLKNFADANAAMPRTWPSNKAKELRDCRVLCGESSEPSPNSRCRNADLALHSLVDLSWIQSRHLKIRETSWGFWGIACLNW